MKTYLLLGAWGLTLGAVAEPSWGDLAQLGTYTLAAFAGYLACFRLQVQHERSNVERERDRADQERVRTQESEARERKLAEVVLPALQEANKALTTVTIFLERESRERRV